jgi:hypothetical protein
MVAVYTVSSRTRCLSSTSPPTHRTRPGLRRIHVGSSTIARRHCGSAQAPPLRPRRRARLTAYSTAPSRNPTTLGATPLVRRVADVYGRPDHVDEARCGASRRVRCELEHRCLPSQRRLSWIGLGGDPRRGPWSHLPTVMERDCGTNRAARPRLTGCVEQIRARADEHRTCRRVSAIDADNPAAPRHLTPGRWRARPRVGGWNECMLLRRAYFGRSSTSICVFECQVSARPDTDSAVRC